MEDRHYVLDPGDSLYFESTIPHAYRALGKRCEALTVVYPLRDSPIRGRRMIEIRFHGRGGQGAVVASKVLAVAFFTRVLRPILPCVWSGEKGRSHPGLSEDDQKPVRFENQHLRA